jgi:hypothetical protein
VAVGLCFFFPPSHSARWRCWHGSGVSGERALCEKQRETDGVVGFCVCQFRGLFFAGFFWWLAFFLVSVWRVVVATRSLRANDVAVCLTLFFVAGHDCCACQQKTLVWQSVPSTRYLHVAHMFKDRSAQEFEEAACFLQGRTELECQPPSSFTLECTKCRAKLLLASLFGRGCLRCSCNGSEMVCMLGSHAVSPFAVEDILALYDNPPSSLLDSFSGQYDVSAHPSVHAMCRSVKHLVSAPPFDRLKLHSLDVRSQLEDVELDSDDEEVGRTYSLIFDEVEDWLEALKKLHVRACIVEAIGSNAWASSGFLREALEAGEVLKWEAEEDNFAFGLAFANFCGTPEDRQMCRLAFSTTTTNMHSIRDASLSHSARRNALCKYYDFGLKEQDFCSLVEEGVANVGGMGDKELKKWVGNFGLQMSVSHGCKLYQLVVYHQLQIVIGVRDKVQQHPGETLGSFLARVGREFSVGICVLFEEMASPVLFPSGKRFGDGVPFLWFALGSGALWSLVELRAAKDITNGKRLEREEEDEEEEEDENKQPRMRDSSDYSELEEMDESDEMVPDEIKVARKQSTGVEDRESLRKCLDVVCLEEGAPPRVARCLRLFKRFVMRLADCVEISCAHLAKLKDVTLTRWPLQIKDVLEVVWTFFHKPSDDYQLLKLLADAKQSVWCSEIRKEWGYIDASGAMCLSFDIASASFGQILELSNDLVRCNGILVPIADADGGAMSHWSLLVYQRGRFRFFDSMIQPGHISRSQKRAEAVKDMLEALLLLERTPFVVEASCFQQRNSYDCGPAVCVWMEELLKGRDPLAECVDANMVREMRMVKVPEMLMSWKERAHVELERLAGSEEEWFSLNTMYFVLKYMMENGQAQICGEAGFGPSQEVVSLVKDKERTIFEDTKERRVTPEFLGTHFPMGGWLKLEPHESGGISVAPSDVNFDDEGEVAFVEPSESIGAFEARYGSYIARGDGARGLTILVRGDCIGRAQTLKEFLSTERLCCANCISKVQVLQMLEHAATSGHCTVCGAKCAQAKCKQCKQGLEKQQNCVVLFCECGHHSDLSTGRLGCPSCKCEWSIDEFVVSAKATAVPTHHVAVVQDGGIGEEGVACWKDISSLQLALSLLECPLLLSKCPNTLLKPKALQKRARARQELFEMAARNGVARELGCEMRSDELMMIWDAVPLSERMLKWEPWVAEEVEESAHVQGVLQKEAVGRLGEIVNMFGERGYLWVLLHGVLEIFVSRAVVPPWAIAPGANEEHLKMVAEGFCVCVQKLAIACGHGKLCSWMGNVLRRADFLMVVRRRSARVDEDVGEFTGMLPIPGSAMSLDITGWFKDTKDFCVDFYDANKLVASGLNLSSDVLSKQTSFDSWAKHYADRPMASSYTPTDGRKLVVKATKLANLGVARKPIVKVSGYGRRTLEGQEVLVLDKTTVLDVATRENIVQKVVFDERFDKIHVERCDAAFVKGKGTLKNWTECWKNSYGLVNLGPMVLLMAIDCMNAKEADENVSAILCGLKDGGKTTLMEFNARMHGFSDAALHSVITEAAAWQRLDDFAGYPLFCNDAKPNSKTLELLEELITHVYDGSTKRNARNVRKASGFVVASLNDKRDMPGGCDGPLELLLQQASVQEKVFLIPMDPVSEAREGLWRKNHPECIVPEYLAIPKPDAAQLKDQFGFSGRIGRHLARVRYYWSEIVSRAELGGEEKELMEQYWRAVLDAVGMNQQVAIGVVDEVKGLIRRRFFREDGTLVVLENRCCIVGKGTCPIIHATANDGIFVIRPKEMCHELASLECSIAARAVVEDVGHFVKALEVGREKACRFGNGVVQKLCELVLKF